MSLRKYLILMGVCTFFCWLAWLMVILYIDPETAGFIGIFCFFISLFVALVGLISLINFFIRFNINKKTAPFRHIGISLRQSLFFSILIMACLFLQQHRLLTWWNAILLVIGLTILEFFFLTREYR